MALGQFSIGSAVIGSGGEESVAGALLTLEELLLSGDYVVCAEQRFTTIGLNSEHILIFGTQGFTTKSTDTPANYEIAPLLDGDILVNRETAIAENSTLTGAQSGQIRILIPDSAIMLHTVGVGNSTEPLSLLQAQRQCAGKLFKLKVGRIDWDYAAFYTVFTTYAEGMELDGRTHVQLVLGDYLKNLDQGLLTVFAGTGGEEGPAELAGEVRYKHYGAAKNVTPRLVLPGTLTYHVSDRAGAGSISAVYDGGVPLTEDTAHYPFANWAAFQAQSIGASKWLQYNGWIRLHTTHIGILTVDLDDVITVPGIIRAVLEEAGVPGAEIKIITETFDYGNDNSRSGSWQEFAQMLDTAPAQWFVGSQINVLEFVDEICKRHGFSRYQDRDGNICFDILDYKLNNNAVAGVDYKVIDPDDNLEIMPVALPGSIWPPKFREFIGYDKIHTKMEMDQIFAAASDAFRQTRVVEGSSLYYPEVTPLTSTIKQSLPSAIDPAKNETALITRADATLLAAWFQLRSSLSRATGSTYLSQRKMYNISLPLATAYKFDFFTQIKMQLNSFWPDQKLNLVFQLPPYAENWSSGIMSFSAYAYGFQHISLYMTTTNLSTSFSNLQSLVFVEDTGFGITNSGDVISLKCNEAIVVYQDKYTLPYSLYNIPQTVGNYLYVVSADGGSTVDLSVFDVTDPTNLVLVTNISWSENPFFTNTIVINDRLYLRRQLGGSQTLTSVNISTPTLPVFVTTSALNDAKIAGQLDKFYSEGRYLYVISETRMSILVYDTLVPDALTFVMELSLNVPNFNLTEIICSVKGGKNIYVNCGEYVTETTLFEVLVVISVETPNLPQISYTKIRDINPISENIRYNSFSYLSGYIYAALFNLPKIEILDTGSENGIQNIGTLAGPLSEFIPGRASYVNKDYLYYIGATSRNQLLTFG